MSNLIPNHDLQLDYHHLRELEMERVEEEDEGDGFPEPCEVARAFTEHQAQLIRDYEENDRRKGERRSA